MQEAMTSGTRIFALSAKSVGTTIVIALILVSSPSRAFAYIDPNAGGLLFQLLTPIAALGAVALSFFRRQCRAALTWLLGYRSDRDTAHILESAAYEREITCAPAGLYRCGCTG